MKKGMLSIVVPAYNASLYLKELLDSFLTQSSNNWELLIVDDLSEDNTEEIVINYSKKNNRIHYIKRQREPKGAQTCRNIGISLANGEYISIIDADDYVGPKFVEQRILFMDNNPQIDYATFKGMNFYDDEDGNRIISGEWGIKKSEDILSDFLSTHYPFGVWNNVYKSKIPKMLLFDEKIYVYQDFDFIVRTIIGGYKHAFVDECEYDYYYRQRHAGTITSNFMSKEKYVSTMYLFEKTLELIRNNDRYCYYKKCFFDFFLLQYTRVLIGGTFNQCTEFQEYFSSKYGFSNKIRSNIVLKCVKNDVKNQLCNRSRKIHFFIYLLYCPKELFVWVKNKILNN